MSCLGTRERLQSAPALVKIRCVSPLVSPLRLGSCRSHTLAYTQFCRDSEFGLSTVLVPADEAPPGQKLQPTNVLLARPTTLLR